MRITALTAILTLLPLTAAFSRSKPKALSSQSRNRSRNRAPKQRNPTPERYREIQEALSKKGYLTAPANGVWDSNSVDALKRFQQDQNLDATGRLNSLSLIALGLGPKYEK